MTGWAHQVSGLVLEWVGRHGVLLMTTEIVVSFTAIVLIDLFNQKKEVEE